MITYDLYMLLPKDEYEKVFENSDHIDKDNTVEIDFVDYLYEVHYVEIRPRAYRDYFMSNKWCVEIYDWSKNKDQHITTLASFDSRKDAVHGALIWYYREYSVKNS